MTRGHPHPHEAFGVLPALAVAGDQIGLLVALLALLAGTVIGLFTRRGSGIGTHPWGHRRGGMAPEAADHDELSGRDEREHTDMSFGTR